MFSFIVRKILAMIPMMLLMSFLIFCGMEAMPGDAASSMIDPSISDPAQIEALREALGLNANFIVRYFLWLGGLLTGNLGYSTRTGASVSQMIGYELGATISLSLLALILSTLFGTVLGMVSALRKGKPSDGVITFFGMLGVAVPQFIFCLILIIIFGLNLAWFPVGGIGTGFWDRLYHLILPAIALSLSLVSGVMRYTRSAMLDSMNKDYVKTALSKGLGNTRVNLMHGLRPAYTPVAVLIGLRLPMLIGGAVVVEKLFQFPGLGNEFLTAIQAQDFNVVMVIAFMTVIIVLISSFLVDILTALIDPRVKLS